MPPNKKWIFFLSLIFLTLPPITNGGELVGFIKKETVYPFSGFEGQLLFKGEPAAGAKMTRIYEHRGQNDRVEEVVITDESGRFKFESVKTKYRRPLIAAFEYLCDQDIFVEYNGEKYQIWGGSKTSKEEYGEFGGAKPKNLTCEITEKPKLIKEVKSNLPLASTCNWDDKL